MYMWSNTRYFLPLLAAPSMLRVMPPRITKPSSTSVDVCKNRSSGVCDGGSTGVQHNSDAENAHMSPKETLFLPKPPNTINVSPSRKAVAV